MNSLLDRAVCRASSIVSALLQGPAPRLSELQAQYASDLRSAFAAMPATESSVAQPSEAAWVQNVSRLRELVLQEDLSTFLRWDVIRDTMFAPPCLHIYKEFAHLRRNADWPVRWRQAIRESPIGFPPPFPVYPASSSNLIHHAYHAAQFEQRTGLSLNDFDLVVEFGGGYGSMCRLFHQLGFRGRYIIFDLPPFSELQKYYLRMIGLNLVVTGSEFINARSSVWCGSDADAFASLMLNIGDAPKSMFVATWSLSETPVEFRSSIMPFVRRYKAYLIAYQEQFGEVNNRQYFADLRSERNDVAWQDHSIGHIPGSRYLFGVGETPLEMAGRSPALS